MKLILFLLLFFPLAGGLFSALFGRRCARRTVERVACWSVGAAFLMALAAAVLANGRHLLITFFTWFQVADLTVLMDVYFDPLAAAMAVTVTFVSTLIHIYSVGYMRDDPGYVRYFCFLNLFVFSMLVITLADNLVFLFLGWEGVGFCSYGLIGFWYRDPANATAGRKAFLLTRIGDVAFGVVVALAFAHFGDLSITFLNGHAVHLTTGMATLFGVLLLWAAAGKSAQLPLTVWLPDAMAGPTPVSALIHAATMVTAGLYLLMRLFPLFSASATALAIVAAVGTVTALYAACAALAQRDIKRVLAYSTISQLGYMFLAVGAGDLTGGMFHLITHAVFKALLFLGAGCIIHALHGEQDLFAMGRRVRRGMPAVFWTFLFGAAALAALPPTAGYVSKDRILLSAFLHGDAFYQTLWAVATVTAVLTTLYTVRLVMLAFTGGSEESESAPIHPPADETVQTLWPLGILALVAGVINLPSILPGGEWLAGFLATSPGVTHHAVSPAVELNFAVGNGVLALLATIGAIYLYGPRGVLRGERWPGRGERLQGVLGEAFYLDRLYEGAVRRPYVRLAAWLWEEVDAGGVDRTLRESAGGAVALGRTLRLWTTGRLSTVLLMIFLGLTVILCVLTLKLLIA